MQLHTPNFFYQALPCALFVAVPVADLHVADVAAVDGKAYGCADVMESVAACGARVDMEQVIYVIVDNLQDVRVA